MPIRKRTIKIKPAKPQAPVSPVHDVLASARAIHSSTQNILANSLEAIIAQAEEAGTWVAFLDKPSQLCDVYKITSYLYYRQDTEIMSDMMFDRLCTVLFDFDLPSSFFQERNISKESLNAGTGYDLPDEPYVIRMAAILQERIGNGPHHETAEVPQATRTKPVQRKRVLRKIPRRD